MAVQDALSKMARGLKDLQFRWEDTRSTWKDSVADQFEEKYLKSWERDFRSTAGQIDGMSVYIGQIRRDCE
jgi:hypothetical protein